MVLSHESKEESVASLGKRSQEQGLVYSLVIGIVRDGEGSGGRREIASSSADGKDGRESEVDDRAGSTLQVGSSSMAVELK